MVAKRLPPLPRISDIIRLYGLSARQQLSQNFLLDLNVTDKIVKRVAKVKPGQCVCEVGPGPGALTRSIINADPKTVTVVEKDSRFLPLLEQLSDITNGKVIVTHGDILNFDWEASCDPHVQPMKWEEEPPSLRIIGNLPFSVSIPLLLQWMYAITTRTGPFKYGRTQMTLTFQKEVAERIMAGPGHPQRSRLSIMVQNLCHVHWGYLLPSTVFTPKPKVDGAVLRLTPLVSPVTNIEYTLLEKVVKLLFQYRRKYIRNGAKLLFPDSPDLVSDLFSISGVDDTLRPQQLTLTEFEKLCTAYSTLTTTTTHLNNH